MDAQTVLAELEIKAAEILAAWQSAKTTSDLYAVANAATAYFWPLHRGHDLNVRCWVGDAACGARIREIVDDLQGYDTRYKAIVWERASLAEKRAMNESDREYRLSRRSCPPIAPSAQPYWRCSVATHRL